MSENTTTPPYLERIAALPEDRQDAALKSLNSTDWSEIISQLTAAWQCAADSKTQDNFYQSVLGKLSKKQLQPLHSALTKFQTTAVDNQWHAAHVALLHELQAKLPQLNQRKGIWSPQV